MSWVPIASTRLTSSSSTITFSSIPATFKDLVVVSKIITNSNLNIRWRLNNDTSSIYDRVSFYGGFGASPTPSTTTTTYFGQQGANSANSNIFSSVFSLHDYLNTSKYGMANWQCGNGQYRIEYGAGTWRSTAAVNRIDVYTTGSYLAGSTFSLYGIEG